MNDFEWNEKTEALARQELAEALELICVRRSL